MAFLIKNQNVPRGSGSSGAAQALVQQYVHCARPAQTIPATTTDIIYRVFGGRILVHLLVGEVTTVIQAQATTLKVTSKRLDNASVAVGTAVDLCATADGNAKEVGSLYVLLGSGAAPIWSNAGAGLATLGRGAFVVPQGEIYLTTAATSTGAMKWDLYYQPLDEGAYAVASPVAVAI